MMDLVLNKNANISGMQKKILGQSVLQRLNLRQAVIE